MIDIFYLRPDGSLCRYGAEGDPRCWVGARGWDVNLSPKCDFSYFVHWGYMDGTLGCGCTPRRIAKDQSSHRGVMEVLSIRLLRKIAKLSAGSYSASISSLDEPRFITARELVFQLVESREGRRGCPPHHSSMHYLRSAIRWSDADYETGLEEISRRRVIAMNGKLLIPAPAQLETLERLARSARDLGTLKYDALVERTAMPKHKGIDHQTA